MAATAYRAYRVVPASRFEDRRGPAGPVSIPGHGSQRQPEFARRFRFRGRIGEDDTGQFPRGVFALICFRGRDAHSRPAGRGEKGLGDEKLVSGWIDSHSSMRT
jgi:hypothetical protein